ncbi:oxysterol binding protein [Trichophyton tonsurans CBS 112818]|uniref:Oxysterol binding protein n=1 Tax=Trichophyton tonsurans (strain CBS 112818) TaxID=647933 RepID=F2RT76_TRIT1|nr:oxysterol binding protein [Trichophyton tonsurans CBS 112818]
MLILTEIEYWNYLDRPESFASIGKSDDELGRMLEVLRFWFTKDLKYVKGKPCKPYNSVLGEFFRCNWEVKDTEAAVSLPKESKSTSTAASRTASKESISKTASRTASRTASKESISKTASIASTSAASASNSASASPSTSSPETVKISYITEQTSHHPPVSAFWVDCPQRGITARGFDQISAKFTGTSVRITPGQHNLGIFITLAHRDNEEYRLTHPDAHLGGLLRGALSVSVADTCYLTCPRTRIKAILQYLEDGWLSKAQHRVVGAVFRYNPDNDTVSRIKDIPATDLLAEISGSWHERIYFNLPNSPKDKHLLIDVTPLVPASKITPPAEKQLAYESRRLWADITAAIHAKQYSLATRLKHELEESQRSKAALRKENNHEWTPRFFTVAEQHIQPGRPHLTDDGRRALDNLHHDIFDLDEKLTPSGEFAR